MLEKKILSYLSGYVCFYYECDKLTKVNFFQSVSAELNFFLMQFVLTLIIQNNCKMIAKIYGFRFNQQKQILYYGKVCVKSFVILLSPYNKISVVICRKCYGQKIISPLV